MKKVIVLLLLLTFIIVGCGTSPPVKATNEPVSNPTEKEIQIHNAYHAALQGKDNPKFEPTPTNLSSEQFKKWMADLNKRHSEYENKKAEEVAKKFGVTTQEVIDSYLKVVVSDLKK